MSDSFKAEEWSVFVAYLTWWWLHAGLGLYSINKTVLTKQDSRCWNLTCALIYALSLAVMAVAWFFSWRETSRADTPKYRAEMSLYLIDAVFAGWFPFFISKRWKAMAFICVALAFAISACITGISFSVTANAVSPWLALWFTFLALSVFVFLLMCVTCLHEDKWPIEDRVHAAELKRQKKEQEQRRARAKLLKQQEQQQTRDVVVGDDDDDDEEEDGGGRTLLSANRR